MLDVHDTLFGRVEYLQKSSEDLVLADQPALPSGVTAFSADRMFDVGSLTVGYIREIGRWGWATVGFGAEGTLNVVPAALEAAYGSRTPTGGLVFFRLRPTIDIPGRGM